MSKSNEKELRTQAALLLRAMNKVTGISAAEIARKVGLHKGNISAFINQGRTELLGTRTISALLRRYGFEFREDTIRVRAGETCPVIDYPMTDEVITGLHELSLQLHEMGMRCSYRPFQIGSDITGLDSWRAGGLLFTTDGTNIWTAIGLDRGPSLSECIETDGTITIHDEILLHEDKFEQWRDSAPHRSELVEFCKFDANKGKNQQC